MNCTLFKYSCLSCGENEGLWKGHNNPKFPQTDASYNLYQTNVIGGSNNSRNRGITGSSFAIFKRSLVTSIGNYSGPGDKIKSVPIITTTASSGIKARLNVSAKQTGVDVKHGSYERYLSRKRGFNMRCQGC